MPSLVGTSPVEPLAGFAIGVTAERRRDELSTLLQRRGASIVEGTCVHILPVLDDQALREATLACIAQPVDYFVATTGIGVRGWLSAANAWGLLDGLHERLAASVILSRGSKVTGQLRAADLVDVWSPASESSAEMLAYMRDLDLAGRTVVVQLHGDEPRGMVRALRVLDANVLPVVVYRCEPPANREPMARLLAMTLDGRLDALTFTSAPAVTHLLAAAAEDGVLEQLLVAMRERVVAFCVGPVTAGPLVELGVPTVSPDRARLGGLVRTVIEELPRLRSSEVHAGGHRLEIRPRLVVADDEAIPLAPAPAAILAALAAQPGHVVSRAALLERLGGVGDEHAVEMAVARLRSSLGPASGAVRTVVKRGYRLATDVA